jgi:predicted RNase H-like nuclease (RuvC/YqgF family)
MKAVLEMCRQVGILRERLANSKKDNRQNRDRLRREISSLEELCQQWEEDYKRLAYWNQRLRDENFELKQNILNLTQEVEELRKGK